MKKLIILSFFLLMAAAMATASSILKIQDVIGEWKYEVMTAPNGYQKGVIEITENKSVLGGVVKFDSGNEARLSEVIIDGDILKIGLYVEYEYVTATIKLLDGKMEGTIDSSQGKMTFKAEKKQ